MEGKLFSQDFLFDGIRSTPVWEALSDATMDTFHDGLKQIYAPLAADSSLNEANTEADIIEKVLGLLDWRNLTLKQVTATSTRRDDVPDFLLFANEAAKQAARAEKREDRRYRHGIAIIEAKRWMRPLDRGDATDRLDPGTPSNQMLRYLSSVEVASERKVRWGVLTNGAVWRLYWQGARSRSEEFLEIDLAALLGVPGATPDIYEGDARHNLQLFYCMFRRDAFLPQAWDREGRTFHEYAFNEARLYEEKVSQDLGARVFASIFPQLADALAEGDEKSATASPAYLAELREATLILLYRLLFILYAEDRNLLPVRDKRYDDYALRKIREDIARRSDQNDIFSNSACRYWQHLTDLFRIISQGDASIGMPAYNGGLFEENRAPLLARAKVPDARFAPLLDDLSRRADLLRAWINYRDLSVQHLGGIYERLLEYSLVLEDSPRPSGEGQGVRANRIVARPASFARKTSGSYYTHDGLVKLIIKETVGPLVDEKLAAFHAQLAQWSKKHEIKPDDWKTLDNLDPSSAMLDIKVCDPAMGSGHFLVSLVDWMADAVLEAIAAAELEVVAQSWAKEATNPWASPLVARIKDIRNRILTAAHQNHWTVTEAQLDDRHIVRRMILKRVIFGVDKNPMAVELAKVALWLHTFTVGAPLSFLDHHLRCGDSLFGGKVCEVRDALNRQGSLIYQDDLQKLNEARNLMLAIGNLTDIDIAEAHHSKAMMDTATTGLRPLWNTLDFLQSRRWAGKAQRKEYDRTWADLLANHYGDNLLESVKFFAERKGKLPTESERQTHATVQEALRRALQEHFLHWELAFPTVWQEGRGGFDAIIGNPPWDRIKLQEVEWFAERRPQIAMASKAADRAKLIAELKKHNDPLWLDYVAAQDSAEIAAKVARSCGDYPLLSGGDINLYSLFVERATTLVKPDGLVGLLTPSGIAADKGAAEFFRTLTTPVRAELVEAQLDHTSPSTSSGRTGRGEGARLAALYDFENKKTFFPDIHSSFKFCALIFGGIERSFATARCAFYLHQLEELDDATRVLALSSDDFSAVNPNTGSAPIFRSQRDADITTAIYRRQPVLVLHPSSPALLPLAGEGSKSPSPAGGITSDLAALPPSRMASGSIRVVEVRDALPQKVWPVRYCTMFHMTNDSGLFKRREELEKQGWYPVGGNRWKKGETEAVPLYVGRMIYNYDHRSSHVTTNEENLHNAALSTNLSAAQKADPDCYPTPQYWVAASDVPVQEHRDWAISFRDIARATDMRTMIAAIIPTIAAGNTLPLVLPDDANHVEWAPLLLANFNSMAFDYIARQKAQSTHLNWYIVEQLPLIRPEQFEQPLPSQPSPSASLPPLPQGGEGQGRGRLTVADFVRGEVLRLTYTAHDLAPFARDLGYAGAPFVWDEEDRRHRLARLDALFFQLYGLNRDDAAYILDQFPIVREQDTKAYGRYLTKDLILAYMNAVAAGDFTTVVRLDL